MGKYGYVGQLKAKPGKATELLDILLEAAEQVKGAKGCHLYLVGKDLEDDHIIWINELWDSKSDHDDSLKPAATQALIEKAVPLLDASPQKGIEMNVVGGVGI